MGARGRRLVRVMVFCEAQGDFQTATGLVDRVLAEAGPTWVADLLDGQSEETRKALREWVGDGEGRAFFDLHKIDKYVKKLGVLVPQGHFAGKPALPDATMGRTVLSIARAVRKKEAVDAVLIVRDMDDQGKARREGLKQAHDEARPWARFAIVVGIVDPEREAWVLAGFEPESDDERERLEAVRKELGFHPCESAHSLYAKHDHDKRSAKRVLNELTGDDREREARCWTHAPLDRLRARGDRTGLSDFLRDVRERLVPLAG